MDAGEQDVAIGLEQEIDLARREIKTDAYAMSIGELVNLYRDNEMDIAPEFQRLFRWDTRQKSRFIESILLGIPLPSIFVAADKNGKWEVVDGLQRLSTVLQFMGELRPAAEQDMVWGLAVGSAEEDAPETVDPLRLTRTKYLPSLEGIAWAADDGHSLDAKQRLMIKRAKMDVKIIDQDSSAEAKYEVFQRLNTGGSPLSDQEVRNVLLLMRNRDRFKWLFELGQNPAFTRSMDLTDRLLRQRYDLELVFRFISFLGSTSEDLKAFRDMGVFLDDWADRIGGFDDDRCREVERVFEIAFRVIEGSLGDSAFRRYSSDVDQFKGPFSVSAFEAISVGVADSADGWAQLFDSDPERARDELRNRIVGLWTDSVFRQRAKSGIRASDRVPHTVPLGREIFHVS